MGAPELRDFLTMLATQRHVSVSTHQQALSALLFLYRHVLGLDLPWLDQLERPSTPKRIPAVLPTGQVTALFPQLNGEILLLAKLLYGTGMRLREGLQLRVKDVDFEVAAGNTRSPLDRLVAA
jgi:site-specific recombinase XerD